MYDQSVIDRGQCLDNDSTKGDGLYNITRAITFSTSIPRERVTEELVAQAWIKTRLMKPEVGIRFTPDKKCGANHMQASARLSFLSVPIVTFSLPV